MKGLIKRIVSRHHAALYGLTRWCSRTICPWYGRRPHLDLVFVVPSSQRGWILEGIAKEIAAEFTGACAFHYATSGLPPAKAYFFVHYSALVSAYRRNPSLWRRKVFVWYTHPREDLDIDPAELNFLFRQVDRIFCSCSQFVNRLVADGVSQGRVAYVPGGADPDLFTSHSRGSGKVGFCTAYYERKSPSTIIDIVRLMPARQFILLGRRWANFPRFDELTDLPNFEYIETDYANYPAFYASLDVFVSVSMLEGGPIPLVEAMMSNVVPVASHTGFAPDLIRQGQNGFVFAVDAPPQVICEFIEQAANLQDDVRATVEHCSWSIFAATIHHQMGFGPQVIDHELAVLPRVVPSERRGSLD
ncbi:MAG: glycosyltransferase involved in cell wall biosynthesis [Candidatus Azotimanducaceae bacterium]|jgi:glycosyltransferase involved in cell wall biosynthesis